MTEENSFNFQQIEIGQTVEFDQIISESMIDKFAEISGDYNQMHINNEYSKNAGFEGRIAHGILLGAFFSRLVGMYLPGKNALYFSQSLKFISPCYPNDLVTISGKVIKKSTSTKMITIETKITKKPDVKIVIGEAKVIVRDDMNG